MLPWESSLQTHQNITSWRATEFTHWTLGDADVFFKSLIHKCNSVIDIWNISIGIFLWWMLQDHINDETTFMQAMVWHHQATSHNLSQCWSRSVSIYSVIRPHWVNPMLRSCPIFCHSKAIHYNDVIMGTIAPEFTSLASVNSAV